jgi:2-oxoglutarate dehydrogenase E1 component
MMIRAFRIRGHLAANLDPLGLEPRGSHPELDPGNYGFAEADMDRSIFLDRVLGLETATLREILAIVRRTYCGNVGVQFMHIYDPAEKAWLQERIEGRDKEITFTRPGKLAILNKLIEAEGFERFLHKRFPGTKRFGLDGGEAVVPAMEQIIKRGGALGVDEIVIGMPHRGRLNTLAAVMGKPYRIIFNEFQGGSAVPSDIEGSGDVKYHLGASSDREFDGNTVHLSLTANPSHLEIVNPVVLGKARAKQTFDLRENPNGGREKVLPLLLHGDAAFAGQGVVAECFALMGLKGYRTGGTIHIIVNNQIGFTTSPRNSRSTPYPSDVALMVQAPILHVNGDDPEAVVYAARVAIEYRQKFGKDAVLDVFCYRRYGHNEGDDPTMTQPLMYAKIKDHPSTRELYTARLVEQGVATAEQVDDMVAEFQAFLDAEFEAAKGYKPNRADWLDGKWQGLGLPEEDERRGSTGVKPERLVEIGLKLTEPPAGFDLHKTVARVIEGRRAAVESGQGIDWGTAEHLAFGTLLDEGFPIRLSGQDSVRGTFTQRHSAFTHQTTEERYLPLANIRPGQAEFEVIDSLLSEEAVLGFEYGYSLTDPNTLTLWEAQFGDFVNGAQVVIDQFISSGERKWLRMCGLVMLLPHGYEGQGPEHSPRGSSASCSSARRQHAGSSIARPRPTTSTCCAQVHRPFRKPLIIMTPKSLLRHKRRSPPSTTWPTARPSTACWPMTPTGSDIARRQDHDRTEADAEIRRVVVCSGKVYYDLLEEREKRGIDDVYLLAWSSSIPGRCSRCARNSAASGRGTGLVPGGTEEHGGLDLHTVLVRGDPRPRGRQGQARALRRPARLGLDRRRVDDATQQGTGCVPRRGLRVGAPRP